MPASPRRSTTEIVPINAPNNYFTFLSSTISFQLTSVWPSIAIDTSLPRNTRSSASARDSLRPVNGVHTRRIDFPSIKTCTRIRVWISSSTCPVKISLECRCNYKKKLAKERSIYFLTSHPFFIKYVYITKV